MGLVTIGAMSSSASCPSFVLLVTPRFSPACTGSIAVAALPVHEMVAPRHGPRPHFFPYEPSVNYIADLRRLEFKREGGRQAPSVMASPQLAVAAAAAAVATAAAPLILLHRPPSTHFFSDPSPPLANARDPNRQRARDPNR